MRHVIVISGHPISIGFHGLMGCQRESRGLGRHNEEYEWSSTIITMETNYYFFKNPKIMFSINLELVLII